MNKRVCLIVTFVVSLFHSSAVWACGNEYYSARDHERDVKKAERALSRGNVKSALLYSLQAYENHENHKYPVLLRGIQKLNEESIFQKKKLLSEARSHVGLVAMLRVSLPVLTEKLRKRIDYAYPSSWTDSSKNPHEKKDGSFLRIWALEELKKRAEQNKKPAFQAHYAEALWRTGKDVREAKRILELLEKNDLMPDAWAYRALAGVYEELGEKQKSKAALKQCKKKAGKYAKKVCR